MISKKVTHGGHELAELVRESFAKGEIDYSLNPITLGTGYIHDGDSVVFCCRRGEREIELTEMFTDPSFEGPGFRDPDALPRKIQGSACRLRSVSCEDAAG